MNKMRKYFKRSNSNTHCNFQNDEMITIGMASSAQMLPQRTKINSIKFHSLDFERAVPEADHIPYHLPGHQFLWHAHADHKRRPTAWQRRVARVEKLEKICW